LKFAVIVFPGSNCDHDIYTVINSLDGASAEFVWHKEKDVSSYDAIAIPGGFSYGDYLRAGAIARFSPIMESVIKESKKGKPIIGICNGFQVLVESGLLPGALIINSGTKFLSKNVSLTACNNDTIFTNLIDSNKELVMPIAHRQGNYMATDEIIKSLEDNNQIAFKYSKLKGGNPNGSIYDIAGVFNKEKTILGMMPHPERAAESILGSSDGLSIFKSMLK